MSNNKQGVLANDSPAARRKSAAAARGGAVRRPGRPPAHEANAISRQTIVSTGLKMSRGTPLQDLSIVMVAKEMEVTPALIHYYIGGREWLTSGVMNLFYKNLLKKWPEPTGKWEADIMSVAELIFRQVALYPGIAAYLVSNSRFRIFQLASYGDRDYGVEMLERFIACVRAVGLSGERTGIHAHLMLEFIINTAHGASHHIFPSEHRQFLEEKTSKLDVARYPNIHFTKRAPLSMNGDVAFEEGMSLFRYRLAQEAGSGEHSVARGTRRKK